MISAVTRPQRCPSSSSTQHSFRRYFIHLACVALSYISAFAPLFTTAAILSYICSSLSMANLDNLPQPSSSCLQLGLGGSISSLFISVLCLTIFLLRRLFLLFIIIILFSQHTLLLLDFSTVWFCKIPRPLNTRWLLWNIKMLALHGTDPLHLHRFAVAQPQPVEVVTLAGWLFLRHSRCTLGQRIF